MDVAKQKKIITILGGSSDVCRTIIEIGNNSLFSKLALTLFRHNCTNILNKGKFTLLKDATKAICNELDEFFNLISSDSELQSEVSGFLYSFLSLKFENGLEYHKKYSIDEIEMMDKDTYTGLKKCGFLPKLRTIVLDILSKECREAIDEIDFNFQVSAVSKVNDFLDKHLKRLSVMFKDIESCKEELKLKAYDYIITFRSNQIYDIVIDFPDSKIALNDLSESCQQTNGLKKLSNIAKEIFCNRLLHLGASTSDIITQYINAIQALNIIDDMGVLTRSVSPPIQNYLGTRPDLFKTIFEKMVEDYSIMKSYSKEQRPNDDDILRDEIQQRELDEQWKPEPLHSHIRDLNSLIREASDSDALTLLLNIYGSINNFVIQLYKGIAQRVKNTPGYVFDNEVRAIELLKNRFGSQSFQNCEVILHDIGVSRRLQCSIDNDNTDDDVQEGKSFFQPLVISHMYWPEIPKSPLNLPDIVKEELDKFEQVFKEVKKNRVLDWNHSAGVVELEISFNEGEILTATVTPLYASVLYAFSKNTVVTAQELSDKLGITKKSAESALLYWLTNLVIVKNNDDIPSYSLSNKKPPVSSIDMTSEIILDDDDTDDKVVLQQDEQRKRADKFKPFVRNLFQARPKEKFTVDSFFNLLVRYIPYADFKISKDEFVTFIPIWIDEGWLILNEDEFRMNVLR